MRIVSKLRLERVLGEVPKQTVTMLGYSLIYGQASTSLRLAEEKEEARKTYMGYFELCRQAATCHPTPYASFARMPTP